MELHKRLVVDLDDTITITTEGDYAHSRPIQPTIDALRRYKADGFEIIINSSRNMRTYECNVGKINIHTLPNIVRWLDEHDVPYDEIIVGKPWCGFDGFYVDDKAIRPSEFHSKSYEEIVKMLKEEKAYTRSL